MGNHVYNELYCHAIWSTKWRRPLIDKKLYGWLVGRLTEIATTRHAQVIAAGVVSDHVHILMKLPVTAEPSDLIGQIKGASSYAYNSLQPGSGEKLVWQTGYGIKAVQTENLETVGRYVRNQSMHHSTGDLEPDLENDGFLTD